ncbi:MAG: magnesium/cobalt transporter CorA [Flavobacteriales bacterium]|nr:magnesium/cobalt transporter CorA [Flavobacteriales bacterium]
MASINTTPLSKTGLPPGSLAYIGPEREGGTIIASIAYAPESVAFFDGLPPEDAPGITWIDVQGLQEVEEIAGIGEKFDIHELVLEDAMNTLQRPKFESYDDYHVLCLKMIYLSEGKRVVEHITIVWDNKKAITFQETKGDIFDNIRKALSGGKGKLRTRGVDYLVYRLLDTVVDHYLEVLADYEKGQLYIEEEILENRGRKIMERLARLRKEMAWFRKQVFPLREAVMSIAKTDHNIIDSKNVKYYRDLVDHINSAIENIDLHKESLAGMQDHYMSKVSFKTNEIVKVLTIISTIFIPLTFIVGVYGMNFRYMPELEMHNGYAIVWGLMIVITLLLLWFFKRKKWL